MNLESIKKLNGLSIVLSIFNQENLIERVLYSIFKNTTTSFNLILVFDGCTDKTKPRALKYIRRYKSKFLKELITTEANNVYETKANNIGFRLVKDDIMITLQDDMVIDEYGWERRLTYPLRKFDDVLAVTARASQNIVGIEKGELIYEDKTARESHTLSRNIFSVRDVINRGPVAFNMTHLRKLDFLDESYSPSDLDDADLSLRAWEKYRLRVGAYWIKYISPLHWGKGRSDDSTMYHNSHISKNSKKIIESHKNYIDSKIKHNENIKIEESEIDYEKKIRKNILIILKKPYRINKKSLLYSIKKSKEFIREFVFIVIEKLFHKDIRKYGIRRALLKRR